MTQTVSHSRFTMFRCIVAMAHADNIMDEAEIAYMEGFLIRVPFSDEQKMQLIEDMSHPQQVFNLFREINDPQYRGQVLHFCRLMAHKDGNFHPDEKDLMEKLHLEVTEGLDMDAIGEEARAVAKKEIDLHDLTLKNDRYEYKGVHAAWFWILDRALLSIGIDMLKD